MATNPYSYGSLGQRWTVGEPTSKSLLDVSRVKADANRWALEQLLSDPDDTSNYTLTATTLSGNVTGGTISGTTGTYTGALSAQTLTANNGILYLDDNGSHNGLINVPASLFLNIDSDNGATNEKFQIAKDRSGLSGGTVLFELGEDGDLDVTGGISGTTGTFSGDLAVDTDTLFVDASADRVGIGTASPDGTLHVHTGSAGSVTAHGSADDLVIEHASDAGLSILTPAANNGRIYFGSPTNNAYGQIDYDHATNDMVFATAGSGKLTITGAGNCGIGTSSPSSTLNVAGTFTITGAGQQMDNGQGISAKNASGTYRQLMVMDGSNNLGLGGTVDGGIIFYTSLGNERARITSAGNVGIGQSSPSGRLHVEGGGIYHIGSSLKYIASSSVQSISSTNNAGAELTTDAYLWINRSSAPCVFLNRTTTTGQIAVFYSDLTAVGSISVTASATAYNTSSDYRLKENLAPITGAVDRVNALQPRRFNFISDPDTTVDGFLAHEVSDIVPEAITGEKDAVDADGNPEYQGIDQSKLVPLLTAAIQELTARIEALEAA